MKIKNIIFRGVAVAAMAVAASCSEDYLETEPAGTVQESDVNDVMTADPAKVQSYVTGMQMNLYCGGDYWTTHDDFGLPATRLATELWCEDVAFSINQQWFCYDYQLDNRLGDYRRTNGVWNQMYLVVDNANQIITMLKPAEGEEVTDKTSRAILGEAYATRAYAYYMLINLWQHPYSVAADAPGVPLKTEDVYRQERVPVKEIYAQILSDIELGYNYLKGLGYHSGNKVGLSEYAAAGIYANVLMFTGDYANAAKYAELAIAGGSFNSEQDMLSGFNSLDMPEVIWGYNVTNETTGYYASFFSHIDSYTFGYSGMGYGKLISSDLLSKIDENDVRKKWFGYNAEYNVAENNTFAVENAYGWLPYVQNKFRDSYSASGGNAEPFTSAIIYTRIAEMYLVAAEAYWLNGDEANAKEMLNTLMVTRNSAYNCTFSGDELYKEICLQKRIETWMEGCRVFDAKRRGEEIDRTVSTNHTSMADKPYSARSALFIFRIPTKELQNNPAITEDDDNPVTD